MNDILTYKLSYQQGRVGSYVIKSQTNAQSLKLSSEFYLKLNGLAHTIWQSSHCHYPSFRSHYFEETNESEGQKRHFNLKYNRLTALVHASRKLNGEDAHYASVPYLEPYSDALALVVLARHLSQHNISYQRVPMLGKTVVLQQVSAEAKLSIARVAGLSLRQQQAPVYHYSISPGGAHVYVSSVAPYPIVLLQQPYEGYSLQATLEHYSTHNPSKSNSNPSVRKGRGRRRTKRERRRRSR